MISKEEYIKFAENGFNIVPLVKTIEKDLDSPIKVFSRIKNKKNTFLLESIEGGEKWAQYSIIGLDCKDSIKVTEIYYAQLCDYSKTSNATNANTIKFKK